MISRRESLSIREVMHPFIFVPGLPASINRPASIKMKERISVKDFNVKGNGIYDDTVNMQRAVNEMQIAQNGILQFPSGTYLISDSINVANELYLQGDGMWKTNIRITAGAPVAAFRFATDISHSPILGGGLQDMLIECGGNCDGIVVRAESPFPISRTTFKNLWIRNCRDGMNISADMGNVVYMNRFENIVVSTSISRYGFFADSIAYNFYNQIEATNVLDGAYAFYLTDFGATVNHLSCDGVAYIDIPCGSLSDFTTEGIAANFPPMPAVLFVNRSNIIKGTTLINIDNLKCDYGVRLGNNAHTLEGVKLIYTLPIGHVHFPLSADPGASGVVSNWEGAGMNLIESYWLQPELEAFKFIACDDLTHISNLSCRLAALPVAAERYRGNIYFVKGAPGFADVAYICYKDAMDVYGWVQIC